MSSYHPNPIDTRLIQLSEDILELTEHLAENAHDLWAKQRLAEGWQYGFERDDSNKLHPCLVAYKELPESEKTYDRLAAMETLKAIVACGYTITKTDPHDSSL